MKKIITFFIFLFIFLNSYSSYAEDSLTVKQQLDRIMEEVKDLNKAVFNKSFVSQKKISNDNDTERFTSIDIRIYDIEKDIKNLTLLMEETLFKLDDLTNEINSIEINLLSKIKQIKNNSDILNNKSVNEEGSNTSDIKEENTLGKLVISDNNQELEKPESKIVIEENKNQNLELTNLSPEEQLQFALDQMMKKNYEYSKEILKDFIIDFPNNQLSGSAHFWLGKIYLFESNFRKAAIVFGEWVEKFPESIKAAEMYYELAKSLKEMKKNPEACKILSLLDKNYKGNKFTKDPEKIKNSLSCEVTD